MEPPTSSNRPVAAVSALVEEQGRILLVKRGREPNKGLWSLPGGSIELGETATEALVREVREETSLEVEPGEVIGVRDVIGVGFHYVVITFRARVIGGELAAGSDAEDAAWFTSAQIADISTTEGLPDHLQVSFRTLRLRSGQAP